MIDPSLHHLFSLDALVQYQGQDESVLLRQDAVKSALNGSFSTDPDFTDEGWYLDSMTMRFIDQLDGHTAVFEQLVGSSVGKRTNNFYRGYNTWGSILDLIPILPELTRMGGDVLHLMTLTRPEGKTQLRLPILLVETSTATGEAAANYSKSNLRHTSNRVEDGFVKDAQKYATFCAEVNANWLQRMGLQSKLDVVSLTKDGVDEKTAELAVILFETATQLTAAMGSMRVLIEAIDARRQA
jgi:hypothetical protein